MPSSNVYRVTHQVGQNLLLTFIWKLRFSPYTKTNSHINVNGRLGQTWCHPVQPTIHILLETNIQE